MSAVPGDRRARLRRGTVLSIESVPASPGGHPAGPPAFYRWRRRAADPEEQLRRVHAIAATMGVALVEAVTGGRPVEQLARWVHPRVLERLRLRAGIESRAASAAPGATGRSTARVVVPGRRSGTGPSPRRQAGGGAGGGSAGPTEADDAARAPRRYGPRETRLRRVRAIRVAPEEYEASVVVDDGERTRALALRIHKPRGQWQIVEAEIG
ncbi:Rv3235 family protein [Rothia sp. AR01]|uniref:Rv3235 family protein n=1 Tax=Rothia santali TaxID=2949643 RepID=A0A9X2HKC7_9MICC|nr:Rv3235 family protein [Rothia santali]MCP3426513.1 Rv3235 family protein [Rothia santali]